MSRFASRPYAGASDLPSLIDLAQRVAGARPAMPPYYHPGDFVWQLAALDATDDVRLWLDDGRAIACGIFEPPVTFQFEVEQADLALYDEIIAWVESRYVAVPVHATPIAYQQLEGALSTAALEQDYARIEALEARGYARARPAGVRYSQRLNEHGSPPKLPAGAVARHVLPSDIDERVDLHCDAWSVWGTSSFGREQYERLRAAPLYDDELDIVVEFEGRLVSYCIGWLDAVNEAGYFEPVGTRPAYTGRGFGRTAMVEGLHRMRERGMSIARVGTAAINAGAQALYRSAGFIEEEREYFYSKGA